MIYIHFYAIVLVGLGFVCSVEAMGSIMSKEAMAINFKRTYENKTRSSIENWLRLEMHRKEVKQAEIQRKAHIRKLELMHQDLGIYMVSIKKLAVEEQSAEAVNQELSRIMLRRQELQSKINTLKASSNALFCNEAEFNIESI